MDVAELGLKVNTSGFKQGAQEVRQASNEMVRAADSTTNSLRAMEIMARRAFAAFGIYKFSDWIRGSIDMGARFETLGVVLNRVGTGAGYTGTQLTEMSKGLQRTGISMTESRQSLIKMIGATIDLTAATKLARVAQDAAVVGNVNSSEAFGRLVSGIETGNSEILKNLGLTVQMDVAYRNFATTAHKSVESLTRQERAQARVNAVLESGKTIAGAYESSMDTAGKQMKSMERYVEDLRVKLGLVFQPAYTALVFTLAETVKTLANNMNVLVPILATVAARFGLAKVAALAHGDAVKGVIGATMGLFTSSRDAAAATAKTTAANVEATAALRTETEALILNTTAAREAALLQVNLVSRKVEEAEATLANAAAGRDYAMAQRQVIAAQRVTIETTQAAIAAEIEYREAMYANALALEAGTVARAEAAAAQLALNAANTTGAMVLTGLSAGASKLLAVVGGPYMAAILAATYLTTKWASESQEVTSKLTENADAVKAAMAKQDEANGNAAKTAATWRTGMGLSADALDKVAAGSAKYTTTQQHLADRLEATRAVVIDSFNEYDAMKTLWGSMSVAGAMFNRKMIDLNNEFAAGRITGDEYNAGLLKIQQQYPQFSSKVERVQQALALFGIEQKKVAEESSAMVSPLMEAGKALFFFGQASEASIAAMNKSKVTANLGDAGRDLERQIEQTRALSAAQATGNERAIEAVRRKIEVDNAAASKLKELTVGNDAYAFALGHTEQQINDLATFGYEVVDGKLITLTEDQKKSVAQLQADVSKWRELTQTQVENAAVGQRLIEVHAELKRLRREAEDDYANRTTPDWLKATGQSARAAAREIEDLSEKFGANSEVVKQAKLQAAAKGFIDRLNADNAKAMADEELRVLTAQDHGYSQLQDTIRKFREEHKDASQSIVEDYVKILRQQYALQENSRLTGLALTRLEQATTPGSGSGTSKQEALNAAKEQLRYTDRMLLNWVALKRPTEDINQLMAERLRLARAIDAAEAPDTHKIEVEKAIQEERARALRKPMEDAISGVQQTFNTFFDSLLRGGKNSFQLLADAFREIFTKMLSGLVAAKFSQAFSDKIFGALREDVSKPGTMVNSGGLFGKDGWIANNKNTAKWIGVAGASAASAGIGYQSGSPLGGALSGALSGAAVAGPYGAIVAGVAGLIGGLMGQAKKAREAADKMAAAQAAFGTALDQYVNAASGKQSALGRSIQQSLNDAGELAKAGAQAYFPKATGAQLEDVKKRIMAAGSGDKRYDYGSYYLAGLPSQGNEAANEALNRIFVALKASIRKQVEDFTKSIDVEYLRATGRGQEADLQALRDQWKEMQQALTDALTAGGMSAEEYAIELDKLNVIFDKKASDVREANARAQASFNLDAKTRLLSATGQSREADDLRRAAQYEEELRAAREKGYDTTMLLAAQTAELEKIERERANRLRDASAELGQRMMAAGGNALGAELARAELQRVQEVRAAEEEFGKDSEYVKHLKDVQAAERDFAMAQLRKSFADDVYGLQRGLVKDPVIGARMDAEKAQFDASVKYGELLKNNVITLEQYNEIMKLVGLSTDEAVKAAEEQVALNRRNFGIDLLSRQLSLDPKNEVLKKGVFDAQWNAEYDDLMANARKLRDSGQISDEMFADFAETLAKQYGPAARDAAYATREAAAAFEEAGRVMQGNLTNLGQEWDVFGADASQKVKDLANLFGFTGKTDEQVRAMFTRTTAGVELTKEQIRLNDQITQYLQARRQETASLTAIGSDPATGGGAGTSSTNTEYVSNAVSRGMSSQEAVRLIDVATSQLVTLREIAMNTKNGGGNGTSVNVTVEGGSYTQTPAEVGHAIGTATAAAVDESLGRRVGVDKRLSGNAML